MKIVVTGAAGFIGKRLVEYLLKKGTLKDSKRKEQNIDNLILFDIQEPKGLPDDKRLKIVIGDISDKSLIESFMTEDIKGVFHLSSIVSSDAEDNFDLGIRVNIDETRNILEACRKTAKIPRVVFASSVAVYGGNLPDVINDNLILTPQTSYGTQKAICELLVNDYRRKTFIDGCSLRLPTIIVRPIPNKAASTFISSIIRELLKHQMLYVQ